MLFLIIAWMFFTPHVARSAFYRTRLYNKVDLYISTKTIDAERGETVISNKLQIFSTNQTNN